MPERLRVQLTFWPGNPASVGAPNLPWNAQLPPVNPRVVVQQAVVRSACDPSTDMGQVIKGATKTLSV